jgi:hypothetical protein
MNGSAYLALEYLACLLLAFTAGIALFVCAATILAAGALGRYLTGKWQATVEPELQEIGRRLRTTRDEFAICVARTASVTAHSAASNSIAGWKRGYSGAGRLVCRVSWFS